MLVLPLSISTSTSIFLQHARQALSIRMVQARRAGSPGVIGAGVVDVTGAGVVGVAGAGVTGAGVTGAGVLTARGPVKVGSIVGAGDKGSKSRSPSSPPGSYGQRNRQRVPNVRCKTGNQQRPAPK